MFKLVDTLKSSQDNTIKYIYVSENNEIAEISYINKNDGKDILCVPTQTSCNLGCKFCHLTGLNVPVRSFNAIEIYELVQLSLDNLELKTNNPTLLISYMGSGEPLANIDGVLGSAFTIEKEYNTKYKVVRFAVASILPSEKLMNEFIRMVELWNLNVKFHLSLHSPFQEVRNDIAPAAIDVERAVNLLALYNHATGNQVEAHYTLMNGVNDTPKDIEALSKLLNKYSVPLKILRYSERAEVELQRSTHEETFQTSLESKGVKVEFYDPPGRDIGSSCGMFLTDYYNKFVPVKNNKRTLPVVRV
jgi:23S rRNA (adenine2503-C2)-methyltransferase